MLDRVIQFELCTVQCGAVRDLRSFAFGIQSCRLNCIRYASPHTCSKMLLSHTLSPGGGGSHEGRTTTSHHSRPHTEQCSHTRPRILTPRHIMWLRYPTCHARAHPPPTSPSLHVLTNGLCPRGHTGAERMPCAPCSLSRSLTHAAPRRPHINVHRCQTCAHRARHRSAHIAPLIELPRR